MASYSIVLTGFQYKKESKIDFILKCFDLKWRFIKI